jgi:anion-transporting  ArsA/GET3 family ATPase|tara:strand:- start:82 stop:1047 length:966 start_codon:yes stop_codon:yes gene_type:complete
MTSLYDRRMVLFSGKGGVGKTTLASAFALSCARKGQRTLLIELNVKDRLNAIFGSVEVGPEIVEIEQNLFAVNISPRVAMEEYGLMKLRVKVVYKAVFENRVVQSFLRVVPGLNDLLMLGKSHFHAMEVDSSGKFIWDKIVIDAPATGHGIFFLKIPSVITSILESGPMFSDAKKIEEFLRDPKMTAINLVTLPEEMPVNETLELRQTLVDELKMPIGMIVANSVYEPVFDEQELQWVLDADPDKFEDTQTQGFVDAAKFRAQRVEMQAEYLERLENTLSEPFVRVPYYFTERFDFQTIAKIADEIDEQLGEESGSQRSAG